MSVWDDPELQVNDDYFSFNNRPDGTSIEGTLASVEKQSFTDGSTAPKLNLTSGVAAGEPFQEMALTAGAIELRKLLQEKRPEPGQYVKVTQTGGVKVGQGTKKLWTLEVGQPQQAVVQQPAQQAMSTLHTALPGTAASAASTADQDTAAALLARLTLEERKALFGAP